MAASCSSVDFICLSEDDVPGAKLSYSTVDKHSLVQLKRWLKCRDIKCTGNKPELVKRVEACIAAGEDQNIAVSIDGGKWYDLKQQQRKQHISPSTSDLPIPPVTGWNDFPSVSLPKHYNYGHIHHHIVESVQHLNRDDSGSDESDIEDVSTSKPLSKWEHFFKSGHVQEMKDAKKGEIYFLKAVVLASYEVNTKYHIMTTMSHGSGFVKGASCTCKAGAMGRCAHVTAVLIAVNDYIVKFGCEPVSKTSRLCEWNRGRKRARNPQNVAKASYSGKKKKVDSIIERDMTPSTSGRTPEQSKNDLLSAMTNSPLNQMWELMMPVTYQDYKLDAEEMVKLKGQVAVMTKSMSCDGKQEIVQEIVQDQNTVEWHNERRIRATASMAKRIVKCKSAITMSGILRDKLWKTAEQSVRTAGMHYGIEHEKAAFEDYETLIVDKDPGNSCNTTGFWVNGMFPGIGASPDGLVNDVSEGSPGLLEIKCPSSLRDKDISQFDEHLSKKQMSNFCLERIDGVIRLKESHTYYYQIQRQLGVLQRQWCDLFIWGSKGNHCRLRVNFDRSCWERLQASLIEFHKTWLAPEFFEMRIPRRLLPLKID